jgi:tetratricopeptide (TPR) repeat protein
MENDRTPDDGTLSSDPLSDLPAALRDDDQRAWIFAPEQIVGHRYRIVRFLAAGGIGEVYEAEDLEMGGRVALKTLRAGLDANETTIARFRREVQLARRVAHPNVCRTFDSFAHVVRNGEGTEVAQVLVVSMELLEGETLSDRIERDGALPVEEALPLARQIVAGLQAAHDAGVIHRDLKARNIVLVPEPEGVRVALMDFGLARHAERGKDPTLTESGALVGTPAYMAPEQILGKQATEASDVYSLGVVLYEMVTGERPFRGGTPISLAVQRLKGPPRSPAAVRPGLPRNWEEVILRCLELEPEARFGRVEDVIAALDGRDVEKAKGRARNKTVRRRLVERVAAGAFAVVLVVVAFTLSRLGAGSTAPSATGPVAAADFTVRRSVAVLPLRSLSGSGESGSLSYAFAELLRAELAAASSFRLVPAAEVARASIEIARPDEFPLSRETLGRLESALGADLVLEGSFFDAPGDGGIRVDTRLLDGSSGEVLAAFSESGADEQLSGIASMLGEHLRSFLGVPPLDEPRRAELAALCPPSVAALELHAMATWGPAALDPLKATELLGEAIRLEPSHAPSHAALADAWWNLGMRRDAQASAATAVELSVSLPRADRLWNEARLAVTSQEWERAIEIYHALFRYFPDDLLYGLALIEAQQAAGNVVDAGETIAELRRLPGAAGKDPRIDFAEAEIARRKADFGKMETLARDGVERARETGNRVLAARGELMRSRALRELGRHDEALQAAESAAAVFREIGDSGGEAEAVAMLGLIDFYRGRYGEAEATLEKAVEALLSAGFVGRAARIANAAGGIPFSQGRLADAEEMLRRASALAKEAGDDELDLACLVNMAQLREMTGRGDEAVALAERIVSQSERRGRSAVLKGGSLFALGRAELCRGRIDRAEKALQNAREIVTGSTSGRFEGYVFSAIAALELQVGDLDAAESAAVTSLEVRETLGDRALVAESQVLLGEVALARGDAKAAAEYARAGIEAVSDGIAPPMESTACELLARARLAQGDLVAAKRAIAGIDTTRQENPHIRITHARTRALIRAYEGDRADALRLLEEAALEARRYGIVPERLAVELAAIRIRLVEDPTSAVTLRALSVLESEATRLGFGLVARDAAGMLGAPSSRLASGSNGRR